MVTKQKYDSIQLMRAIAAITVIFVHVYMFGNGAFGVDLFFCISGFIMMYVTEKNSNHFLEKRAIRLVPLYWIATILTSVLLIFAPNVFRTTQLSAEFLLKSLIFIPFASGNTEFFPIVNVGWTLVLEVFYYIIFFISLKINHKHRHLICGGILLVMVFTGLFVNSDSVFVNFYCRPIILEFLLGMFAFKILNKFKYKRSLPKDLSILIASLLIFIFLFAVKYIDVFNGVDRFLAYGVPCFILFLLIFILCENRKIPRFFVMLGDISYSIYLTHTFIVQGFSRIVYNIDEFSVIGVLLVFLVVLPVTIAVSWFSWFIIENKFTGWLRKKLIR